MQIDCPAKKQVKKFGLRGQAAIEFMAVIGMVLIFFVLMQIFNANQVSLAEQQQDSVLASNLASQWATTITTAGSTQGITIQQQLPGGLDNRGTPYGIFISNQSVFIDWNWGGNFHTALSPVSVQSIRNSTGSDGFWLEPGDTYSINNTNGVVWVTQ